MIKQFHKVLGLALCLLIFVISITGVALLLKPEYLWLDFEAAREQPNRALVVAAIDKIQVAHQSPGRASQAQFVRLYAHDLSLHKVYLSGRRYAWHNQSGETLQVWQANERLEDWLLDLHHRFLLGNTVGLNMAGFSGLLLLPLMALGILIWWPRRKLLRTGFFPQSWRRGALLRSHGNLGVIVSLPVALIAITGVILVYPSESRWLLVNGFSSQSAAPQVETHAVVIESLADQLAYLESRFPQSTVRWISLPSAESPVTTIGLQAQSAWDPQGQSSIRFTPENTVIKRAQQQGSRVRLIDFSYALHTGGLGLWYRLLVAVLGFALASLTIFGLLSYLKRGSSTR